MRYIIVLTLLLATGCADDVRMRFNPPCTASPVPGGAEVACEGMAPFFVSNGETK